MQLQLIETTPTSLRAGYECPCGCTPSVNYAQRDDIVEEGCCCGNDFAVGRHAGSRLTPKAGFRPELQVFEAPWGERLEAAWLVGPSVHGPAEAGGHEHAHGDASESAAVIDPVCGMTVDPETARAKGLHSSYQGRDFFFCGKGCKLEFDDDPQHYLDPSYVPSM